MDSRLVATSLTAAIAIATAWAAGAQAEVVTRTVTDQNGVTYRQQVRVSEQVQPTTEYQTRQEKVYQPQTTTTYQNYQQNYLTPVTQYRWVARRRGVFNPFVQPYWTHQLEPFTHWENRAATVQVPVPKTDWVEQTRTVQTPVTTYRTVRNETVLSQVAINGNTRGSDRTQVASQPKPVRIGGIQRLDTNVPRTTNEWRANPAPSNSAPSMGRYR